MRNNNTHRPSRQSARILEVLRAACGSWVPLPEILALGIAQYSARILELRRLGFNIENKTEWANGARHSWFRLVSSPTPAPEHEPVRTRAALTDSDDWYERQHGPRPAAKPPSDDLPLFGGVAD